MMVGGFASSATRLTKAMAALKSACRYSLRISCPRSPSREAAAVARRSRLRSVVPWRLLDQTDGRTAAEAAGGDGDAGGGGVAARRHERLGLTSLGLPAAPAGARPLRGRASGRPAPAPRAAVDLQPAQGVVEVAAAGEDVLQARAKGEPRAAGSGPRGSSRRRSRSRRANGRTRGAFGSGAGASLSVGSSSRRAPPSPRPRRGGLGLGRFLGPSPRAAGATGTRRSGTPRGTSRVPMQQRVRQVVGRGEARGPVLVEAGEARQEGLALFDDGLVGLGEEVGEQARGRAAAGRFRARRPAAGSCRTPRGCARGCSSRSRRAEVRMASTVSRSIVKSSRAARATARSMRTGSSRRRTAGSPIVRITRFSRSSKPAHVVDHRERRDVVEERVDREVAAEGVLFRRAEGVVAADQGVALFGRGLLAEGRDLDHLACRTARGRGGSGGPR